MTQANLQELAKQGDSQAIASLMNHQLASQGITAKVSLKNACLQVILESKEIPNQGDLVEFVRREIKGLGVVSVEIVKVYGKQTGEDFPAWNQEFELLISPSSTNQTYSAHSNSSKQSSFNSYQTNIKKQIIADDYRVPGEKEVLYASLGIIGFFGFILLGISLGTVVLFVAISAFWIKMQQSQYIGSGVKVSERQLPEIYNLGKIAAERLSMRMPDMFVVESPIINASAMGFLDDRKTVVIHTALIEAMNEDEILSIIGHEFSHIKCNHTNWLPLTNTAESIVRIPIISDVLGYVFKFWSRKGEYTCDRGGLIACRNLKASVSALAKLSVGGKLFQKMDLDAFLEQKADIEDNGVSKIAELFGTHPYVVNRIHEVQKFYNSSVYKQLTLEHQ